MLDQNTEDECVYTALERGPNLALERGTWLGNR